MNRDQRETKGRVIQGLRYPLQIIQMGLVYFYIDLHKIRLPSYAINT